MDRLDYPTSLNPAFGKTVKPANGKDITYVTFWMQPGDVRTQYCKEMPLEYSWIENNEGGVDLEAHFPKGTPEGDTSTVVELTEYIKETVSPELRRRVDVVTIL